MRVLNFLVDIYTWNKRKIYKKVPEPKPGMPHAVHQHVTMHHKTLLRSHGTRQI